MLPRSFRTSCGSLIPADRTEYFNRRAARYLGVAPDESFDEAWEDRVHPADLERALGVWKQALAGANEYTSEYRLRVADGTYRWNISQARPLRDGDGNVVWWIMTCTDIDDRVSRRAGGRRGGGSLAGVGRGGQRGGRDPRREEDRRRQPCARRAVRVHAGRAARHGHRRIDRARGSPLARDSRPPRAMPRATACASGRTAPACRGGVVEGVRVPRASGIRHHDARCHRAATDRA